MIALSVRNAAFLGVTANNPSLISGLQLWLKADAITGLADAQAVATWPDSSGNGRDATQATGGLQPTYRTNVNNGKPAVRFDGSDDRMSTTYNQSSNPFTIFIVYSYRSATSTTRRALQGSTNWLMGPYNGTHTCFDGSFFTNTPATVQNQMVLSTLRQATGLAEFWVNRVLRSSNNPTAMPSVIGLGAQGAFAEPLNGDIAELIIYNRALANAEINIVNGFLYSKYTLP